MTTWKSRSRSTPSLVNVVYVHEKRLHMRIPRRRIARPSPEHKVVSLLIRTTRVPTRTRTSSIERITSVIGQYAISARPSAGATSARKAIQGTRNLARLAGSQSQRNVFCRRTQYELSSTFDCGKRGAAVGCGSVLRPLRCDEGTASSHPRPLPARGLRRNDVG